MTRISDNMFRARVQQFSGKTYTEYERRAFGLMREGLTAAALAKKQQPHLSVYSDQIVWGRFVLIWQADGQILLLIV